jgi:predicted lysophospholipase L1 biosynthesis ABC-type transport system permease subunit
VIACINFMNLSTARASRRTKEVGIKKSMGADRQSIIFQFLGESLLMAFSALLVALLLVGLLLPGFNGITGKALSFTFSPDVVLSILTITVFTGLLAGSYPALYLSGFRPAAVLKGNLRGPAGELWARRGLVVFQFALSVILIVSVLVVYRQIAYVQTKNLGYNRDNILHFTMETRDEADQSYFEEGGTFEKNVETLLDEVKNVPGVIQATNAGGHNLTGSHGGMNGIDWREGLDDEQMDFANLEVGYDFIELFGIQLTEGRAFSRSRSNERLKVVFNEEAIRVMGLKNPVGKTVRVWGQEKQIIGVAKNFHYESLYQEVKPCIFQFEPRGNIVMLKIAAGRERETIDRLTELYRKHSPGLPFEYAFVDQDYQALYAAEQRVSVLSRYFAGIAILISCLGLLGLAAFTAERRRKEIGIRKVLGSTEAGIVYLLSNDFTRLVGVAIGLALPVSYLLASTWLKGFAYRIELEPWYFLLAGLLALTTALLTVGLQAFKAARINPVECLKEE